MEHLIRKADGWGKWMLNDVLMNTGLGLKNVKVFGQMVN